MIPGINAQKNQSLREHPPEIRITAGLACLPEKGADFVGSSLIRRLSDRAASN